MDDPYRSASTATRPTVRPLTRRRPWRRLAGAALAMATGPIGILVFTARYGFDWLGTDAQRRDAEAKLRALPFAVTPPPSSRRAVVAVTIALEAALGERDAETWSRAAIELVPRLTVVVDGARITLTAWPWREHDLLLLAQLMDTWGRALHATHVIAAVDIAWAEGGPTQSL